MVRNYKAAAEVYHECRARHSCLADFENKRVPSKKPESESEVEPWWKIW